MSTSALQSPSSYNRYRAERADMRTDMSAPFTESLSWGHASASPESHLPGRQLLDAPYTSPHSINLGDSRAATCYCQALRGIEPLSQTQEKRLVQQIAHAEMQMLLVLVQFESIRQAIIQQLKKATSTNCAISKLLNVNRRDELAQVRLRKLLQCLEKTNDPGEFARLAASLAFRHDQLTVLSKLVDLGVNSSLYKAFRKADAQAVAAKRELVSHHLWLGLWFTSQVNRRGVERLDLLQEANLGLVLAANRFRTTLGHRFATYAIYWIRRQVYRAVGNCGLCVTVSHYGVEAYRRIHQAQQTIAQKQGAPATQQQIAELLRISIPLLNDLQLPSYHPQSEQLLGQLATIEPNAEQLLVIDDVYHQLHKQVASLKTNEWLVLKWRYGLHGSPCLSVREIALKLGISTVRVNQIENEALQRLRHPSRIKQLKAVS